MAVLALLWGSGFLLIKVALSGGLAPLHITVIRCALGAGVLLVLARAARQRMPRERRIWGHLVVAAFFCNALPFFLFSLGSRHVDSGVVGVLNATTPLWSLLIGLGLGTDRGLGPRRLGGLLLGFAGVLLIFAPWQQSGLVGGGALVLLGAGASYAVAFAYMARFLSLRGSSPLALSAAQLLMATGLTTLALPTGPAAPAGPSLSAVIAVIVLGIFGTGITFHLNSQIIATEGPTAAATVGYLLPVVSIALGALVLDEQLSARIIAGMAVVLLGVALTRSKGPKAAREANPRTHGPDEPTPPAGKAASAPSSAPPLPAG
ncbi:DMT family transporter [Streptomyces sp. NPDC051561]|uniref:DMT family transporter n=1 Tax=Streptomyces sp. NPDC051561 TaxID=3365658 RepID=UPI0037973DA2